MLFLLLERTMRSVCLFLLLIILIHNCARARVRSTALACRYRSLGIRDYRRESRGVSPSSFLPPPPPRFYTATSIAHKGTLFRERDRSASPIDRYLRIINMTVQYLKNLSFYATYTFKYKCTRKMYNGLLPLLL